LKAKNQKVTKEAEKHRLRADAAERRSEELSKEMESQRSRSTTVQLQFDHLLKEFNDLMSARVDLDERLTQREGQINELTCLRKELENELTDSRVVMETLEKELRATKERAYAATEECSLQMERCKVGENTLKKNVILKNESERTSWSGTSSFSTRRYDGAQHLLACYLMALATLILKIGLYFIICKYRY